jgi:hypothetical protein
MQERKLAAQALLDQLYSAADAARVELVQATFAWNVEFQATSGLVTRKTIERFEKAEKAFNAAKEVYEVTLKSVKEEFSE